MKNNGREEYSRLHIYFYIILTMSITFILFDKSVARNQDNKMPKFQEIGDLANIVLENEILRASFNKETGKFIGLINKQTGWRIQRRSELGKSFSMLIPLPNRRNNNVFGGEQKPIEVKIDSTNNQLIILWQNLKSEHGGVLDIDFKGIIELSDEGLVFHAEIHNRSLYVIETVNWPYIGDLSKPLNADKLEKMTIAYNGMKRSMLSPQFRNTVGYWGVDYPQQMAFTPNEPFVLINSGNEGLYTGYHDLTAEHLVMFRFELKPGTLGTFGDAYIPKEDEISGTPVHIEFSCIHFPFCNPSETTKLNPIVLKPYVGTWHKGADCYKEWRKSWYTPPPTPTWVKNIHSWQQIHINSPEDELRCNYADLVEYGQDCVKHGVEAIQLTGWTLGGQDRGNPSHDIESRLGTWQDLQEAIEQIQKMGIKVVLFSKFTFADRSQDWFRDDLIYYTMKDPYGDYFSSYGWRYQTPTQLANINTRILIPLCILSRNYRNIACCEFYKIIALGADGTLYDQNQSHHGAYYCFDAKHNHHIPANVHAGDLLLAREFRSIIEKSAPNFLLAGENSYYLENQYYSLNYFRIQLDHIPFRRYLAPDIEMMIAVTGYNNRNKINQALMFRYIISYEPRYFKGRLDEFPLTINYGKKVDALRRKYSDYLWNAEFRHTLRAEVTTDGKKYGNYSVFISNETQKRAIVVANFSYLHNVPIKVELEGSSPTYVVVTPENPSIYKSDGTYILPPLSVVAFLEK